MITFHHGKNRSEENADGQARYCEANEQRHDQTPHRLRSTQASADRSDETSAAAQGHASGYAAHHAEVIAVAEGQLVTRGHHGL